MDDGADAHPKRTIDWTALNLAASIALPLAIILRAGDEIFPRLVPLPVHSAVSPLTWFITEYKLNYALPFAALFLLVRALDLAAPLRAAPIVAWILFLCSITLHVDYFNHAFVFNVVYADQWRPVHYPFTLPPVPLEVRHAMALGVAASWLWVICGFVGALLFGRATLQRPTRPDIAIAFVTGVALPATALASLVPVAINYRDLYAAQEARFRELCKDVKVEVFAAASAPKSVFFDPNESLSCWGAYDGQCQALIPNDRLAQATVIHWQLDFAEFWEKADDAKPPVLTRCYVGYNCPSIGAVTARYRVATRDIQSKADEALGLHVRTVTVDERATGNVLGRLQFVYSMETHRFCAPPTEIQPRADTREFQSFEFIVRALGLELRKRPGR